MGTGFIPGPDFSFIGKLGQSIAQLIDPGAERRGQVEELFLTNPDVGIQFAAAQRELERQFQADPPQDVGNAAVLNVVPNVLEQFGFKLDDTQQLLSAFPETSDERLAQARAKAGLPSLQAEAEAAKLSESIVTSGYREKLVVALDAKGIPELLASQAAVEGALETKLSEFQKDYLDKWITHLKGLEQSNPFEFRRAMAAMNSKEFLRDIQHREELALKGEQFDFRKSLADIEAAQGSADRDLKIFGLGLDAQDNLDTQLDRLEKAFEKGTEEEKNLTILRVNEAAAIVRAVSPSGAAFAVDPGKRKFFSGRLKGVRLTRLAPGSLSIPIAIQYERLLGVFEAADPGTPFETLQQQLLQDSEGAAFIGGLTPSERAKFFTDAQAQHGAIQLGQQEPPAQRPGEELSDEELNTEITRLKTEIKASSAETLSFEARLKLRDDLRKFESEQRRRRPQFRGTGR